MAMLNNQMVSHGLSPDFFYRFRRALAAPGAKGPKPPWAVLRRHRHGRSPRRRGRGEAVKRRLQQRRWPDDLGIYFGSIYRFIS